MAAGTGAAGTAPCRYVDDVVAAVTKTDGIAYGSAMTAAGRPQNLQLALYEPVDDGRDERAAVVYLPGGGFWEGDRSYDRADDFGIGFARKGYLVVSIDYRRRPEHGPFRPDDPDLPDAIRDARHDCLAAVRWLRRHAEQLRLDPRHIFLCGTSAGAVTALYAAFDQRDVGDSGNPGVSSRVAGVAAKSGAMLHPGLIGPDGPGACFFHGRSDATVPVSLALASAAAVRAAGLPVSVQLYDRPGHDVVPVADVVAGAARFFAQRLGGDGAILP